MLRICNLECAALGEPPLRDVTLEVSSGEVVAVTGPNGAGKSTLCRCVALTLLPTRGGIEIGGRLWCGEPWDAARSGVVVLLEGQRVFSQMTVLENLLVAPSAWERRVWQNVDAVFDLFPGLATRRSQQAGTLSGGEQQMVAIGRAMLCSPRLLVLDEPSLGLAPQAVATVYRAVRAIAASGAAILVVEENILRVADVAKRAYLMIEGRTVLEGRPVDVAQHIESHEAYASALSVAPRSSVVKEE